MEGVTYRKTQAHLKPYTPQHKKSEDEHCLSQSSNIQTVKSNCRSLIQLTIKHNLIQDQGGIVSPQLNLIYNVLYGYSIN